jgi:tRNA(fMet)-specific endonuclease VapC
MTRFLLDTCACIDLLRGRSPDVFRRLRRCDVDEVGLSSVTLAELLYGAARSARPAHHADIVARFCAPLAILPFDDHATGAYGAVRAELERRGTPIGPLDTFIAAHALSLGLTVVTGNDREFRRVEGLRVENWAAER